jgi:hypothetical protein
MAEKTETSKDNNIVIDNVPPETETLPQHVPDFFKNVPEALHNRVVGFGKHKSLTFQQLITDQKGYLNWLTTQTWFNSRYPELYEYIKMVGVFTENHVPEPHKISDTDDGDQLQMVQTHNELQARFTDIDKLIELVKRVLGQEHEYNIRSVTFEHWCGADIEVLVTQLVTNTGLVMNSTTATNHTLLFELKPVVSNDYPEILRQIRGQLYSHGIFRRQTGVPDDKITQVLVTQRYDGKIPLGTVRNIYGNVSVVFVT